MSIQTLRSLRLQGRAPAVVWVVHGPAPKWLLPQPDFVHYTAGIDLRPLVGLKVDVFGMSGDQEAFMRCLDAVETAQARIYGIADKDDAIGVSPKHEKALRSAWRLLCQT